jgi:hypothetical protein
MRTQHHSAASTHSQNTDSGCVLGGGRQVQAPAAAAHTQPDVEPGFGAPFSGDPAPIPWSSASSRAGRARGMQW